MPTWEFDDETIEYWGEVYTACYEDALEQGVPVTETYLRGLACLAVVQQILDGMFRGLADVDLESIDLGSGSAESYSEDAPD